MQELESESHLPLHAAFACLKVVSNHADNGKHTCAHVRKYKSSRSGQ